jgi:chaperone required for assembly of F1-ATPase
LMAYEQFKRACGGINPLSYAQEITNRVDGPIVKQVNVTDQTALERERLRFDSAVEAIMKEEGCSRMEAAVALAMVNPIYQKYVEGRDGGEPEASEQAGNEPTE